MSAAGLRARRLRVVVSGWRDIAHSYALACQWTCLSLLKRPEIELRFQESPRVRKDWPARPEIFEAQHAQKLTAVEAPAAGERCDLEYRFDVPHDLRAPAKGNLLVFATAEYGVLAPSSLSPRRSAEDAARDERVSFVVPARWNVDALLGIGAPLNRIHVVPLGFDPDAYQRRPGVRERARAQLGLSGVVLMSAGSMSGNKGIELLLQAFATVARSRPDARLLLKGMDELYESRNAVQALLAKLPADLREIVASRLTYVGETLSHERMAALYQAADCYVAPYHAEGFCMPVLEAAACGLPVICTRGGPTDDFTHDTFSRKIDSRLAILRAADQGGIMVKKLLPDVDHLAALLQKTIDDADWRSTAGEAAAVHAHAHFTWDKVTERLVEVFRRSACQAA